MIVAYAPGAGLGHLCRLRAAHHTLEPGRPITVITDSVFAQDRRVVGPADVVGLPPISAGSDALAGRRSWLRDALARLAPSQIWIDASPAGPRGEIDRTVLPSPRPRLVHLARLLRWDAYVGCLPAQPVRFDQTWLVEEPASAGHAAHLAGWSDAVAPLNLVDPPTPATDPAGHPAALPDRPDPRWLIIHSGSDAEVEELVRYARDVAAAEDVNPSLVAVRPAAALDPRRGGRSHQRQDVVTVDAYPALPLVRGADRVMSAAGSNIMRQLAPWRAADPGRHRFLPMPRRLDDQFTRAARARGEAPVR